MRLMAVLALTDTALREHLGGDARAAESLAGRYADSIASLDKAGQHRQTMQTCEGALLADVARVHHVAPEQVRLAIARQNDTPF